MSGLRDEVVLITGGSSGIGLATADLFSRQGARVWLTSRSPDKLRRAAATLDLPVQTVPADVEDPAALDRLAAEIRDREGRIDVLINSAGQLDLANADSGAVEIAERLMRVNYLGLVRTVAATLPLVRAGNRRSIVNLSSFVGRLVPPYWSAYAASKHAVQAYSHSLRQELRPEGIHVGLVLPGPVLSPMTENLLRTPMYPIPFGVPVLPPDRVAEAILESVFRRRPEATVPRRFGPLLRLASAFPGIVDLFYRRFA